MAGYTDLPADWQSVLEGNLASYTLDLVLDPDGGHKIIDGEYGITRVSRISNMREVDPRWSGRSVIQDVQVELNDPVGDLAPHIAGSPLHNAVSELALNAESGGTQLYLKHKNGAAYTAGERITILGENYFYGNVTSETGIIQSFTPGAETDTLVLVNAMSGQYLAGGIVYTGPLENKEAQIRLHLEGTARPMVLYRGRIQAVHTLAGTVRLVLADLKKNILDRQLTGVDMAVSDRLLCINNEGSAVSSIEWNDDAAAGLDRQYVYPQAGCRPGVWQIDFDTDCEFTLSGPGVKGRKGDIRYGLQSRLSGGDLGFAWHLDLYQGYVYIPVVETGKLVIINAADPFNPQIVSALSFSNAAVYAGVDVVSNYVYLPYTEFDGGFTGHLKCIYTGNKDNPFVIDSKTAGLEGVPADFEAYACCLYGSYLFVTGQQDIFVFNVSDPFNMQYVTRFGGQGAPNYMAGLWDLTIEGHYLFTVSEQDQRLVIVDIQTPGSPVLAAALELDKGGNQVCVANGHAFVKCTDGNIFVMDIADPGNPVLVNSMYKAGSPWYINGYGLETSGDRLYSVSQINGALTVLDINDAPDISFVECIKGADEPSYLDLAYNLFIDGEYAWTIAEGGLTVYRLHPAYPSVQGCEQISIIRAAWSGHIHAGDRVTFCTGRTWQGENPVKILHDLLANHAGIAGHLIDASGFFGQADIGTVASDLAPGETDLQISITAPVRVKTGDVLIINDQEFPVTAGNTVQASYPPVICLSVINDSTEMLTPGMTVQRKALASPDPDFSFDREYQWCQDNDLAISLCLERDMSILQAVECVTSHLNGFTFADNWGVERICSYRQVNDVAISIRGDCNLLPGPELETRELVNVIEMRYNYDYACNGYTGETSFSGGDAINISAWRHGLERRVELSLPGYYSADGPLLLAERLHDMWCNGLELITFRVNLQGLVINIGDVLHVESGHPLLDRYVRVTGKQFIFDDGLEILLQGYDITGEYGEGA